jgi:hypothetical protein
MISVMISMICCHSKVVNVLRSVRSEGKALRITIIIMGGGSLELKRNVTIHFQTLFCMDGPSKLFLQPSLSVQLRKMDIGCSLFLPDSTICDLHQNRLRNYLRNVALR